MEQVSPNPIGNKSIVEKGKKKMPIKGEVQQERGIQKKSSKKAQRKTREIESCNREICLRVFSL